MRLLCCILLFYFLNDAVLGKTLLNTEVKNDIGNLDIVHYQPEQVHLAFGGKF